MPEVVFSVDQSKSMRDQAVPGHNRWHPDIPPAASVAPGQRVPRRVPRVDRRADRQQRLRQRRPRRRPDASRTCSAGRSRSRAPSRATCSSSTSSTSAPCQPPQEYGDAPGQGWGYTGIFAKVNGGGFLTDHFPDAYKAIWDFHGQDATSRHIPGVRYTGITHPGPVRHRAVGRPAGRVEPARAGADRHRPRPRAAAGAAAARGRRARRHADRRASCERVGREGARTVPARENGGNHDIKNFTRGSRVFYPVHVDGREALRRRPALLARATARSRSAARSRWAASSTSAST